MIDFTSIISTIVTIFAGGFGGWFFGRRKYNSEVKGKDIDNFDKAIASYSKLFEEREKIYTSTIDSLRDRIEDLTKENAELRKQIITVANFITNYIVTADTKEMVDVSAIESIANKAKL